MEQVIKRLGQRIRELRIRQGFSSQEKFAAYCGVDRTFMGHLETGRRDFRLSTIIRIAEALHVPVSELFLEPGSTEKRKSTSERLTAVDRHKHAKLFETARMLETALKSINELVGEVPPGQ